MPLVAATSTLTSTSLHRDISTAPPVAFFLVRICLTCPTEIAIRIVQCNAHWQSWSTVRVTALHTQRVLLRPLRH